MGRIARAVPPPQPIATTARMSHGTQPFRRTLRHLAVVSTLVAALVGAAYAGLSWRAALERRQWLATLEQADAQSLRPLLARAGRYGPEGWSAAASLLASTDSAVAAEASAIVLSWIDDPRPLTADQQQQQQRLLAVATTLAEQAHDASDAGRPRLRQVAMRLASVAANQTGPLATQCLAHCQKALDVVTTDRQALASHATPTRFTTRSAAPTVDSAARAPVDPKSPHSLGEFPIDAASRLPLPQLATVVNEPARIRDPVDEEQFSPTPNQDVPSNAAGPLLLAPQRQRPRLVPTPRQPARTSDRDSRRGTLMRHESAPLNTQTQAAGPSPELAPFSAQHNPDPRSAAQAVDDLRRRGYSDFEIELGRMATSPDVYQRRRLAAMLPRLAGVDPRRWLHWLSFDEDAVVRRTVVGWMITTGEASLLARARELAVGDPDDQVRQAAQRTLEGAK